MTNVLRGLTIQRLAVVILFVLLFAMAARTPLDSDMWWHIRSGEYMVNERAIPTTDPFSHTRFGEDWIDHGWGAQLVMYGLYELFGEFSPDENAGQIGLGLYTAVLATLGMAFVFGMCEGNVYVRALAVVLGAAAAAVFWSPRPQMFSFVLGAAVLYLLHLYKRKRLDKLWLVPVIMVVWANLHGGFAIGFIFLFGSVVGECLGNLFNAEDERVVRWSRLKKIVVVTLVAIPAVALNPNGITMLSYPFRTVNIGVLQDYIEEWASPDFHNSTTWPFVILLLGVLVVMGLNSRRADWADLVLVSGTAFMALMAGRNIAVFALVAAPVFARCFDQWLTERGWQIQPLTQMSGVMVWVNWVLLAVILVGAGLKIGIALNTKTIREAQQDLLPVDLAAYLRESPPQGAMFNSYNWGGYFIYAAPNVPVYVDGRTDLYDDEFLRGYLDIVGLQEGWRARLTAHSVGFVAIEHDSVLAAMLREFPEEWNEQVFDNNRASLFVRLPSSE